MNAPARGGRRTAQARKGQARQKNGRFARQEDTDGVTVSGAELLDRLERQAGELGAAQERIGELERALAGSREGGGKAARR
jgi:hypothetical protein